ncbi:1-phosphatidylinositol 4,5-bisphosphate phosphodiesterase delta-4 [Hypsibius exemplaris]|uniref:Phosphoinositide phospholipase C n=1 Tax=Hypsibius exemplaris TaxID=2072580 RepID=A0A1W0WQD7_HYPEX|nr:1-phosphatidylinositol 4,5-bisphosphate phosphodiesterase delta-4 [Hypsibius exemplaris]
MASDNETSVRVDEGAVAEEEANYRKAVENLMRGSDLLKLHPLRTLKRSFSLEADHENIVYRAPFGIGLWTGLTKTTINLRSVKEIREGYATDVFNRKEKSADFCAKHPPELCFSFVMTSGQTVDLIASDRETREMWILVTRKLIDQAQQAKREERLEKWLIKQFYSADVSGDGFLNFEECMLLLAKMNLQFSREQAEIIFKAAGVLKLKNRSEVLDVNGFHRFYVRLSARPELRALFKRYAWKRGPTWTLENLYRFLVDEQKEWEGQSDIGQDLAETCGWMVETFEPLEENKTLNLLSFAGFRNLMLNSRQMIFSPRCQMVYQDMTHPLQHYFIASSHNTYLVDKQLMGSSSIEGYIDTVLTGCRCLELDCWDGPNGEPMITHGYTMSSKMDFKHALVVLRDYGFKTSEYPLILSLENHCSAPQQQKMAHYLKEIFAERLFTATKADTERLTLPSPEELRGCVFIVAKKLPDGLPDDALEYAEGDVQSKTATGVLNGNKLGNVLQSINNLAQAPVGLLAASKVAKELSDCVFVREVPFRGFVVAKDNGHSHAMDNIPEPKMRSLVQDSREEFIRHTQRHLVRVYPDGLRTDSSNMNPIPAMASGCQIVAFNYQNKSRETQVYRALFADNGGCGYLLKPEFMRQSPPGFPDISQGSVRPLRLKVRVISAQQLPKLVATSDKDITDPYVVVEVFGSDRDMKICNTNSVQNNGFNPTWEEEFHFRVHDPNLAVLRFEVRDMDRRTRDVIGQYSIAVGCVQEGFRHVPLLDSQEQPLDLTTLFVHIEKTVR